MNKKLISLLIAGVSTISFLPTTTVVASEISPIDTIESIIRVPRSNEGMCFATVIESKDVKLEADMNSETIGYIEKGDSVFVISDDTMHKPLGWAYVEFKDNEGNYKNGYVRKSILHYEY